MKLKIFLFFLFFSHLSFAYDFILTPIETERLMGWPDDHTKYTAEGKIQADTNRYRQIGNGVASPVARWVAQQIAKVEYAEG